MQKTVLSQVHITNTILVSYTYLNLLWNTKEKSKQSSYYTHSLKLLLAHCELSSYNTELPSRRTIESLSWAPLRVSSPWICRRCRLRLERWPNVLLHTRQVWGRSFSCTVVVCWVRCSLKWKRKPQIEHGYGRSPSCTVRPCFESPLFSPNDKPQRVQRKSRRFRWTVRTCRYLELIWPKDIEHISHTNGFLRPWTVHTWLRKPPARKNVLSHHSHGCGPPDSPIAFLLGLLDVSGAGDPIESELADCCWFVSRTTSQNEGRGRLICCDSFSGGIRNLDMKPFIEDVAWFIWRADLPTSGDADWWLEGSFDCIVSGA